MPERKRYALIGTGGRSVMFLNALAGKHRDESELVAMCDMSQTRMKWQLDRMAREFSFAPVPTYSEKDFDRMIRETKPDTVIVTTPDATHHTYIIRAMELGCDVISEKPMTTDAAKARAIFDAIDRTKRKLRVTFNYRYTPHTTKVREIIATGQIGTPLFVDLHWVLDTSHGADYFRRWHRLKEMSGGLLVHKATHHFDIINWWIDSYPKTVYAMGELKFYGKKAADSRGEKYAYERYLGKSDPKQDPFAIDMSKDSDLKGLYLEAEKETGYIRDRNVFNDDINIEDTMALTVKFRSGVIMSYSLIAYCPWEGLRVAVTGTKGRVELYDQHGGHIICGDDDKMPAAAPEKGHELTITLFPMFGHPQRIEVPRAEGTHGGADPILVRDIFSSNRTPDPFGRFATHLGGAASILTGIAANESIATGIPVEVDKLLKLP